MTGGTGFIGGRLVESLAASGARVRVLARDLSRASRVARYPVELARGDVSHPADVDRAATGADYVFHCAVGTTGDRAKDYAVTVDGTRHVVAACRKEDARLVHVSTISVYGPTGDGPLDESAPHHPEGHLYAETKDEAERAVLEAARAGSLRASVVQPTVVFGPFGPAWTVRTFSELESGRVMLIDGGTGLCNAVYVDDIVKGLRLAATEDGALGEAFLISGAEPVTWREFYAAHERLLGYESHVERTADEALRMFHELFGRRTFLQEGLSIVREQPDLRSRLKTTREVQMLLRAAKLVVPEGARRTIQNRLRGVAPKPERPVQPEPSPEPGSPAKPIHPMAPAGIRMCQAKTVVRIDKARRLLGYEPDFDFAAGMERVADWARWKGLLGTPELTPA